MASVTKQTGFPIANVLYWHDKYNDDYLLIQAGGIVRCFHKCTVDRSESNIGYYLMNNRVIVIDASPDPRVLEEGCWNAQIVKSYAAYNVKECTCNLKERITPLQGIRQLYSMQI